MRRINRRALLKGAAGFAGGAGVAALAPVLAGSDVFAEAGPPPGVGTAVRAAYLTASPLLTYVSVTGAAFNPSNSTTAYYQHFYGYLYQQTLGSGLDNFLAPLPVPHGSVLVEANVGLLNNVPGTQADVWLGSNDVSTTGHQYVAYGFVSSQSPAIQVLNLSFPPETVQAGEAMYLLWRPGSAGDSHRLYGAAIGYLPAGSVTMLPSPVRLVDTRPGASCQYSGEGMFANGVVRSYGPFTALASNVRASVQGLILNLGVTGYAGAGYASLYPSGVSFPGTSTLNYSAGTYAWANGSIVGVGTGGEAGRISVLVSGASTHVFIDCVGVIA